MATTKDICNVIEKIDGKLGKCGRDYQVYRDEEVGEWVVDIHDTKHHLRTFIDGEDVESCIDKEHCLALGMRTGELRYNFKKYLREHALN